MKKDICDFCGSYWNPSSEDKETCGLCGAGSKIKMGSDLDVRKDLRK